MAAAAAAAAKSLQSFPTLCDPIDGSPPGSLGFSRQEHWSGLPFPSPMHESEKWKWSRSVMSDSVQPHRWQPTRLPGILQARTLEWVAISFSNVWKWKVKSESEVAQSCPVLYSPHGLQPTRLLCPWDFPGRSTGVGFHCLLRVESISIRNNMRIFTCLMRR